MELNLYVKEGDELRVLKVPRYVVRDLLRDRLSKSEISRIHRLGEKTEKPAMFKAGSVLADFDARTAQCFQAGLGLKNLEPTWSVSVEKVGLGGY